jgi:L-threonylcarbamoyladenylate synthase
LTYAEREKPHGLLCFDEDEIPAGWHVLRYGDHQEEQAQKLFAALREIDELGWQKVLVRCPPEEGMGLAVYNRLLRAAAFREVEV